MNTHLDHYYRRLRLELVARSEGATGAYDTDSGAAHSKPGSKAPTPDSGDLAHFDHRWANCKTDRGRRQMLLCVDCADPRAKAGGAVRCCVIGLLRSYLIRKSDPSTRKGTQDWRREVALDDRGAIIVGRSYGIRPATVLRCREEFGVVRPNHGPNTRTVA